MDFADLVFKPNEHISGVQATVTFDNGYGASIISGGTAYGTDKAPYEVAVLKEDRVCYDTPITDDVIGFCSPMRVDELLKEIEALPPAE